jgi:hypothetical protein
MTPAPDEPSVGPLTRRSLLAGSVGVASTLAASGAFQAIAAPAAEAAPGPPASIPADPVLAYVSDPKRGEVTLICGHREVTVHDRELAARLIAAAPREKRRD